jgi:hypothetical protein
MDDHMLAIGFVPNRVNIDPQVTGFQESLELGSTLVRKPVTDAKSVFFDFHSKQRGDRLSWRPEIRSYHLTISGENVKAGNRIQDSGARS